MNRLYSRPVNGFLAAYSWMLSTTTGRASAYGLPPAIGVELTNCCNLHCPECSTGAGHMTRARSFMDMKLFDKIITELGKYLYYISLYFQGEPMMHPAFFGFISRSGRIRTIVSTNGHYLTPENASRIVKSGLNKLIVSLDGMDQETYSTYRIGGDLQTVLDGIKNVHDAKKRSGSRLKLEIQFLVSKRNENQIDIARDFASEMKASFRIKSMQIINPSEYESWIPSRHSFSRYQKNDGIYTIKNSFPDNCARLWFNPVITWDGKVLPCCFDKNADHILGDLNEDSFRDIWNGPKYKLFRKSLLSGRNMIDICRNCTSGMKKVVF